MKQTVKALFLLAFLTLAAHLQAAPRGPQEQPPVGVNMFYSDLSPYGQWIEFEPDVYAWQPFQTGAGWRPYMAGRWVWTDYGWYWVSSEPFGWATYHYGRWFFDDAYGWIWIPDTVWGPAWVEWRYNDDYIGWAPLPPYARFHMTVGIRFTTLWNAPVHYWSFVTYHHFAASQPYRTYVPESDARRLISTTRSAGRYAFEQNRIVNRGVGRSFIEQRVPTRIGTAQVDETSQRGTERVTRSGQTDRVEVYRPRTDQMMQDRTRIDARRAETKTSLDLERIDRPRNLPQRGDRQYQSGNTQQQPNRVVVPNRQLQQQDKSTQRTVRPEIRKERPLRVQPSFPTPRVNKNTPTRTDGGRDAGRSRGKGRGGF